MKLMPCAMFLLQKELGVKIFLPLPQFSMFSNFYSTTFPIRSHKAHLLSFIPDMMTARFV
jgi:hypothetical protein